MYTPSACHHTRQPFLESNGCSPNLAVFLYFAQIIETIYNEDVLDVECESNNDGHDDGDVHISGQLETSVMSQETMYQLYPDQPVTEKIERGRRWSFGAHHGINYEEIL